ncbi:PAP2 family protein [Dictyocaulus viviparus]|uniref:PAP2 family protein n=1 Tax=Dictyocaulus viviparus TaxID=29172 RepID=A0A0D8Y2C7_DICVI|nr:PAP2 family protein [Dictyocaulus viviparus]
MIIDIFQEVITMASQDSAKTFNVDMWQINIKVVITNVLMLSGFALIGGIFIPWLLGTYRRGFFCNDLSIRYTYKDSTVSSTCLILYAFCVIIFTIFVAELYSTRGLKRNFYEEFKVGTITVHPMIVAALTYIGYSQIGLAITYVITNLTKNAVGRLRPHFLDVCKPSDVICSIDDYATYITNYTCTGDAQLVLEARKSFFSGHSSIAMYASTYAVCIVWCKMFARHQDEVLPLNRGKRLSHGNSLWRPVNVSRQSASSNVDQKDNHAVVSVTQQNPMIV